MTLAIPQTLEDVIDPTFTAEPAALRAVKALARTKPWQGDFDTRYQNVHACFVALRDAYGIEGWDMVHVGRRSGCSGSSKIDLRRKRIVMNGRLSVVTMLHLFAKVRRIEAGRRRSGQRGPVMIAGLPVEPMETIADLLGEDLADAPQSDALTGADHFKAIRWSVNLFKRCFPISFSRCRLVGGLLVNDGRRDD